MSDYSNAPAPPGALFDNAPANVPAVQVVPPHLTPASRICQDRGGRWMAIDVWMQYGQPIPLELALSRVRNGRTVFVRREDAGAVLRAARGTDGDNAHG